MRGKEVIVVHPPQASDWRGDPTGTAGSDQTATGCIIWPRTSTEDDSRGEIVIDGLNVFVPPQPLTIKADYRVTARGKPWDIDGVPGDYRDLGGKAVGLLVILKAVGT